MNPDSPVIQLCIQGSQAEFRKDMQAACRLYQQAWQQARDDFEHCVAAHYMARCCRTPEEILHWNLTALHHARAAEDTAVQSFYPSLYLNLGAAYEQSGETALAEQYYALAAELGAVHQPDAPYIH